MNYYKMILSIYNKLIYNINTFTQGGICMANSIGFPSKIGLYDPQDEKDSCGVGFVASIKGDKTHDIVKKGLKVLINLTHRGAVGSDPKTGDGAGILTQIPHEFFKINCDNLGIELPEAFSYGIGMVFLPKEPAYRLHCEGIMERVVENEGQKVLGWRDVPVDNKTIGDSAKGTEPTIRQIFIEKAENMNQAEFERRLYIIRKITEEEVKKLVDRNAEYFYISSLSSSIIVYKGLLLAEQIKEYYLDLNDINFKSAIALVHQRYSTNTFPTWDLAQPFRYIAHNGEINTIKGNRNWMNAREGVLKSDIFGDELKKLFPIINPRGSDSASLDNALELLVQDGRSLAHSIMMLIPQTWKDNDAMSKFKTAFYEYHSSLVEPWDGPAALVFTDGVQIGAVLDRNGLRPARYSITKDGLVVLASEAGVLGIGAENISEKGKLKPGKMFLIDTKEGRIVPDDEIKRNICTEKPYIDIMEKNKVTLNALPGTYQKSEINQESLKEKQNSFGYTMEDLNLILGTMAATGKEPLGSMGNDTPLAVLSNKPQLLFSYFKQHFAQVTNPPVDSIREESVMSLVNFIGTQENLLNKEPNDNSIIEIETPVLTNEQLYKIVRLRSKDFKSITIPMTFKYDTGIEGFKSEIKRICERASSKIKEGYNIIVLSDRNVDAYDAPIPSLLAVSALHHYLIKEKTRTKISIVVETAEARETMHIALLIGYGATAVNPYLAIKSIRLMLKNGDLKNITEEEAENNYVKALSDGLLKILSKMGISTLQSYQAAEIFEAVGLSNDFVDQYFSGTSSKIGGIGIDSVAKEVIIRHKNAFNLSNPAAGLEPGGYYSYRKNGEFHLSNPQSILKLQSAVKNNDYIAYKDFAELINNQKDNPCTLRGLLKFKETPSIDISEVEPVNEIVKRFCTGAMSFGSISREAHETIAIAMNRLGAKSNSGEGGEERERFVRDENGDLKRSAIKQVASGRFGVTTEYLVNSDEIQIKMAQGAKPGEGGQLPGKKVDEAIGRTRHSTPGISLISPPPHHDIYSIEDLSQLILDLKGVNPSAKISVKLVSENGVGTVAAGVAKAHADTIVISGYDGGTGAAALSSTRHVGLPWEIGLSEAHQVLLLNNLRSRVRLQTDGQLKTGRDVVIAALMGAEEFAFGSSVLMTLGCVMCRRCHLGTCEMGIATQNEELRKKFKGKPEYITNYFMLIAQEVRELMAKLGFRTMNEMIGRVDVLEVNNEIHHWKANQLDFSSVLYKPDMPKRVKPYCTIAQDHKLEELLDFKLIQVAKDSIENGRKISASFDIKNVNRSVGAMLSGKIAEKYGEKGLPEDTITFNFYGSAGQSFGGFAMKGLSLILEGEANDYVGKGLSGGKIVIKTPVAATYKQDENVIAGNTALYGATSGEVYINGLAGERYAVRNSGAVSVVEGVGDNCCEYMTDGVVVILGSTGRNFAAGMSGGTAYVLDENNLFEDKCNKSIVTVNGINSEKDFKLLYDLISKHYEYTNSKKAELILQNFESYKLKFKKVISPEYEALTK